MKPISPVSATQWKPHLPPKPVSFRKTLPAAATHADEHRLLHLKPPSQQQQHPRDDIEDQQEPPPLSYRRWQLDEGPLPPPFPPSGYRHQRNSESRSQRLKEERLRFEARLTQSKDNAEHSSSGVAQPANCVQQPPIRQSSRKLSAKSPPSTGSTTTTTTELPVTSSSVAKQQTIITSSATDVTTSDTNSTMTSSLSSTKPNQTTVTSPEVTGGSDVIYDEPTSSVDVECKSVERRRLVLSDDGYLKLRSDVVVSETETSPGDGVTGVTGVGVTGVMGVTGVVAPQIPSGATAVVVDRCNSRRTTRKNSEKRRNIDSSVDQTTRCGGGGGGGGGGLRSSESVDRLEALLDFSSSDRHSHHPHHLPPRGGGCCVSSGKGVQRSSFVDPNGPPTRRSVYIELGEYQTLLKHSTNSNDDDDGVCLYSLPQPLCYSDDTLRAVKLITQKYDTFKRRQLRALSFRCDGAAVANRKSPLDGGGVDPRAAGGGAALSTTTVVESNNNKSSIGGCSVPGVDRMEPEKRAGEVEGVGSVGGEMGCAAADADPVVARSRQSGALLLRDYCNTLEAGVDGGVGGGGGGGGLSKLNLMRVELFYRSREASVFVCRCLADLFVGTSSVSGGHGKEDSSSGAKGTGSSSPVVHQHTGVPVWVLNSGEGVRGRDLLLVVAERETGFPLWQDKINYLSNYVQLSPGSHSLRVSGSLRKTVRLDMFCEEAAAAFLARFHDLTADPNDDLWKISSKEATKDASKRKSSGQRSKNAAAAKKKTTWKRNRTRLSKASISQPCNFVHISRVDLTDANFRAAFSDLIPLSRTSRSPTDPCKHPGTTDTKDPAGKTFDSPKADSDNATDVAGISVNPSRDLDALVSSTQKDDLVGMHVTVDCEFRPRLPTR